MQFDSFTSVSIVQSVAIHPHFSKSTNHVFVIGTDRVKHAFSITSTGSFVSHKCTCNYVHSLIVPYICNIHFYAFLLYGQSYQIPLVTLYNIAVHCILRFLLLPPF